MRLMLSLGLVLVCGVGHAADPPVKVASVEGVTEYRLGNGARVLLFPEQSRPVVTINMTVLVGSRHEGYGETGMAHLLEHLVFKGTPNFPNVSKALRDHGANFNGTTNVDRTNYFETLPASDDNLDFAVQLEADRLVNSFVRREDLLSEFTVVRNEFERGENSPQGILSQRIHAAAFEWHNYGKSTIGNRSDIEKVPIDNLRAFYKKFYQPDNCILIITGKFDEAKGLEIAQKYLGAIPKPTRRLDQTYTEEPPQDGERTVTLRRVGAIGAVGAAYHTPSAAHADWAPLSLLGGILSQSPNGRLYQALVESKLASSAGARVDNAHDPGLFTASAQVEPDKLDAARDAMLKTLEEMASVPFTDAEIERAKGRSKRNAETLQSDASGMSQALSSASALGDWRLLFIQRDRVAKVSAADVNRVAKTYFQKQNRTVGVYIPETQPRRLEVAAAPPISEVVKDYKGGTVIAAGEAFDPSPANLDARLKTATAGGLKVGLLPKKNRGETVSLVLTLHYGNEESLKGLTTAAGMLPNMMMAGTKGHDRQALREALDALGVRISAGTGGGGRGPRGGGTPGAGAPGQLTFSVEAKRETLPAALKLLGEILREPAFPAAEFETLKRGMRSGLAASASDPAALASNKLARSLSPYAKGDVRYVPTPEESIARVEEVTLDQVRAIYEGQLGGTVGELAIVGDFDAEAAVAQVKMLLAGWESKVAVKRIERKAAGDVAGSKENIVTPDKANAVFMAGLPIALRDSDADYSALRLGNFMLGGSTLASRLGDRIRQREGLSYGVSSAFSAPSRDPAGSLIVNAITNPANIDKVEVAIVEEVTKFVGEGPSESELGDAKRAYLESLKVGRTGDASLAGQIAANLELGRTFAHAAEQEKQILALTPQDVAAAFKKHVDPKKLVIIRAGDFKK